ncbi:hypothetical protein SteCoe_31241 [Stentor coeruleus]|uniref:Uncharacterized protein n=1 Tax=Stentor coeruleus TaxID=5963 RepID=A0A1R2B1P3_9CILI|nr:hypothetical protein SteCoe_31241 [Stentor coeruleus]
MAQLKHKKLSSDQNVESIKKSPFSSRNCSPTGHLIKNFFIQALSNYTKSINITVLSKQEMIIFLRKLQFLTNERVSSEEMENITYMWGLISVDSHTTISDSVSYLLCLLDLKIPNSLLQSSIVFKYLPDNDYTYIKANSMELLKNYLESVYTKTKQDQNFILQNSAKETPQPLQINNTKTKTPRTSFSRAETPRMSEVRRKAPSFDKKLTPKVPKSGSGIKFSRGRLKRSESGSRTHSKEHSAVAVSNIKRKTSPVIDIELSKRNGSKNKLILYIKVKD